MPKNNNGSKAEDLFRDALEGLKEKHRTSYVRLYDSKAAGIGTGGNVIPAQPADFVFCRKGVTWLAEVKSSVKETCLSKCNLRSYIREEQILGSRIWTRAGARSIFLFYSLPLSRWDIWAGEAVVTAYLDKKRLSGKPLVSCFRRDLQDTLLNLTE